MSHRTNFLPLIVIAVVLFILCIFGTAALIKWLTGGFS